MRSNRTLTWAASIILLVSIIVCAFTLWYVINSKDALSKELNDLRQQLQAYNFPKDEAKDVTVEEAKLYLTLAKFCESHNDCKGADGKDGVSPACVFDVSQCRGADGRTPVKGVDYTDGITPPCYFTISQCQGENGANGTNGTNGADGREIERQCNASANRMEWRYTGDETWHAEFNLAPGQTCPTEGQ